MWLGGSWYDAGAMRVTTLGTGAPLSPRATTGLLVQAEGCEPLLIDACGGFELPRQLARAGVALAAIRNVLLTHRHMDHVGGMPALFLADQPLALYASADARAGVQELMAATFAEWPIHPEVRWHEVAAGERHAVGGFEVELFGVEHRVPTLAVRVSRAGRTLAFSADSIPCDALVACAQAADLFLCDALFAASDGPARAARARELMHPTGREAGELAARAGARRLLLVHIGRLSTPEAILAEAREAFGGPVEVAEDCQTYSV